jgi:hypothetical protein
MLTLLTELRRLLWLNSHEALGKEKQEKARYVSGSGVTESCRPLFPRTVEAKTSETRTDSAVQHA